MKDVNLQEMIGRNGEFIIVIECFDQTHQQTIMETHSYGSEDWVEGVKFKRNFSANEEGRIVLHINELDDLIPLD